MNIPVPLFDAITTFLRGNISDQIVINDFQELSGGCINNGGKLGTSRGNFFLKWNSSKRCPGMFNTESRGLRLLSSATTMKVPAVIGVVEASEYQALLLSFVEPGNTSGQFWETFGIQLAQVHEKSQPRFGLDHDNYIGSLHQRNQLHDYWTEFFIEERLRPQLILSTSNGASSSLVKKFEALFKQLPSLLPAEKPSLLHGDLWRGNLITEDGMPCLIDPAVYYGHREADLAMTQLFGGFDPIFLESYQAVFPLEKGWRDRLDIYNLYPLLVHLNLFGRSYEAKILNILKTFV